MSHGNFPLGAISLIKTTKSGTCRNGQININGTGVQRGIVAVPTLKLWVIQEIACHNLAGKVREGSFLILDESQDLVGYLAMDSNPVFSIGSQVGSIPGKVSYNGTGYQYIPYGWYLGVEIDLKTDAGGAIFYWHISELDLD